MKLQPNSSIACPVRMSQATLRQEKKFQSKRLQLGQGIKNNPGVLVFGRSWVCVHELNDSTDGPQAGEGERVQNVNSSRQPLNSYKNYPPSDICTYICILRLCISTYLCRHENVY